MQFDELKFLFDKNQDKGKNFYYKQVLKTLESNESIKTEEFVEKLQLDIRQVRRILYRLFDARLITYRYLNGEYIWKLRKDSLKSIILREKNKKIKDIKNSSD